MNKIVNLSCTYEYNGEVNDVTRWDGVVEVKRTGYCTHDIEGFSIDQMDVQSKKTIHKRYILGTNGLDKATEHLFFTVFPGNLYPISYRLKYDEEDGCYYGVWHFLREEVLFDEKKRSGSGSGFAKVVMSDEKDYTHRNINTEKIYRMPYFENQYGEAIERRKKEGNPTGEIDEYDENIFNEAKEFFRKNKKSQQYVKTI